MVYDGLAVGQNVRIMREQNHWTIEQLSEAVDKSASHIVQMELGSRKMSLDLLFSLMTVFNVDAKKDIKRQIQLTDGIIKEDLYTAYYAVPEKEELVADREIEIPGMEEEAVFGKMWLFSRRRMLW